MCTPVALQAEKEGLDPIEGQSHCGAWTELTDATEEGLDPTE